MAQRVNGKLSTGAEGAETMAIAALGFLAAEPERLARFLALSGLGPHNLRQAATSPGFLAAVLDHLAADERLLVAFAAAEGSTRRGDRAPATRCRDRRRNLRLEPGRRRGARRVSAATASPKSTTKTPLPDAARAAARRGSSPQTPN